MKPIFKHYIYTHTHYINIYKCTHMHMHLHMLNIGQDLPGQEILVFNTDIFLYFLGC